MRTEFYIERLNQKPLSKQHFEICERKGIGHPDTLCDNICEKASQSISKFYKKNNGFICHHNLDKGLLVGGVSEVTFGGGRIIEPPDVIISGTATIEKHIDDIKLMLRQDVVNYLKKTLRFYDELRPEIEIKIHRGSTSLINIFRRFGKGEIPIANDTSFGTSFAPLTPLEETVLIIENFLNNKKIKRKFPFLGEDIKIMGKRKGSSFDITVAVAFVSKYINNLEDYYQKKKIIKDLIESKFDFKINADINTLDKDDSIYMTVSGTSWENGDDGQVGRGNRANGLITPCRMMSLEAVAGKNPVSHIGKIFNLKAEEISKKINEYFNLNEVQIILLSQIGKPINKPFVGIKYISSKKLNENSVKKIIEESLTIESFQEMVENILSDKVKIA